MTSPPIFIPFSGTMLGTASGRFGEKMYSPRYEELKEKEPERVRIEAGRGNSMVVTYEDGRVANVDCAWMSFEAAGLREQMLKQDVPTSA